MFNMIDIGERAGSGIPNIFSVWKKQGWPAPKIEECYEPERISLLLQIEASGDNAEKVAIKSGDNEKSSDNDKKVAIKSSDNDKKIAIKSSDKKLTLKAKLQQEIVIEYLTEKVTARTIEIAELLGVKEARARRLLSGLIEDGIIIAEGANRNRVYKLK